MAQTQKLEEQKLEAEVLPAETALVKPLPTPNWSSATSARQFLEQLAGSERRGGLAGFWKLGAETFIWPSLWCWSLA